MTQFRGIDPIRDDNWLVTKVKRNPEAFLVLAAGCALLLRGSGLGSMGYRGGARDDEGPYDVSERTATRVRNYASDMRERFKDTAAAASETASGYAAALSDKAGAISERASDYASSLSNQTTDWGRNVADEATRMSARAKSSLQSQADRLVREQPFAIAALGAAAGAAIAALLPPSDVERETLAPIRDAASDAVNMAADRVKGAVAATAEQLRDAAQQKGLTPDGVKDMARNATQTFGDTLAKGAGSEAKTSSPPERVQARPGAAL
jgi:ElaB/YqjD/DUF883 family membrane-anchored ribosome-binding protein